MSAPTSFDGNVSRLSDNSPDISTLIDLLRHGAERRRDRVAFRFSRDGEEHDSTEVSYRGLDGRARQIAVSLGQRGATGEPVLVLCPPGLDFIAAYFGCLYAGAIAVPVHPPTRDHLVPRVESIIADIQPAFAITTTAVQAKIRPRVDGLATTRPLRWFVIDAPTDGGRDWMAPDIGADTVAMVQYTSGSTSAPKGVVLTHGNLVHNLEAIRQAWNAGFEMDDYGVFWLPPFHDMGLIGGLLETLYVGGTSALMPPTAFIKYPMRWLETISRHRAIISAAPNFAYDLCVELSTPAQRAALDLSTWRVALCGAEPVRTATLQRFADAFAPAGFRPAAFLPVYGLAEATLLVSGGSASPLPTIRHVDRAALRDNRVIEVQRDGPTTATLVGCGKPRGGQRVIIVDPETRRECRPDEVGEIWIAGPSVAHGYWGSPEQSAESFSAALSDTSPDQCAGPFLHTGDLGFLHSGELFVAGRRKDLIIIRGSNHYPNDIELTVQDCHPALMPGRGAVVAVAPEPDAAEQLVVVQEVNHTGISAAELAEMILRIRTAVTERHEIRAHAVVLVEPLQLPTTSSGKIQRGACRQQFLDGELPVVTEWRSASLEVPVEPQHPQPTTQAAASEPAVPGGPTKAQITDRLITELSRALELPAAEIDPSRPFAFYGLDSIRAIWMTTALETWLGHELSPTLAYEYPTIDILADHLSRLGDGPAGKSSADSDLLDQQPEVADEPVAIIGIGCRFPGAGGPAAFWQLLTSGTDATSDVPADRWDADAFYDPDPSVPGTAVTRRGGFLNRVDSFDYQFFGIAPRESAQMDPQQRLLLEVAWEALEDAGQVPDRLAGSRTGVFVGISTNDYGSLRQGQPQLIDAYSGTGNALSIAANRLSYVFDFRGPSMAIDTACSSSLVAVDLACRSLRDGECRLALAGGVNIILSPALAINFSKARVMAPDGHCKSFAADADGYVRGEGAGVVVLKPLSRALVDNDPIYAVIRGTATNSDGRTNGLIAPSEHAQEAVLAVAYRRAGLSPGAVQYVEAHGTGTVLGDAIEAKALGTVLADGRPPGSRCLVGSVKTNIGHLEAAAGAAGLIKVALALQHRAIPPSLHFTEPNPHIPFDQLPLDVVQTLTPWPGNGGRAVAGVSSFGFGGTNAHVVLTEVPHVRGRSDTHDLTSDRAELLPLSARSSEALQALVDEYELALSSGASLTDLCYTAGARRGHYEHRLCVVGDSPAQMFESLAAYRQGESRTGLSAGVGRPGNAPAVTFIFSGQGSQWRAMGRQLQAEEPVFREALHECNRAIRAYLGRSVLSALTKDADAELTDISLIQPAIFAVQVALAALWRSWGVQPAAVVGHSMGEVAAAHVAGALSLPDAARVIWARARILNRVRGHGAMLVAEMTQAEAERLIAGQESRVAIAAHNSHRSTVLSGDRMVLAGLMAQPQNRDRFWRWINVDAASHSPKLKALANRLRAMLGGLRPVAPTIPLYSSVTGELSDDLLGPRYWAKNLASPVQFSSALRRLLDSGHDTYVEISPHPILLTAVLEDAAELSRPCTLLPSMRRDDDGRATMLGSLGTLYTRGHPIAWEQIYHSGSRCIPAPTYPWQRVHSWVDVGGAEQPGTRHPGTSSAAGQLTWRGPLRSAAHPETVLAEIEIGTGLLPALSDHQVLRTVVLPVTLLLGLVRSAVGRAFGVANPALADVTLRNMLEFTGTEARTIQFVLQGDPSTALSFECYDADADTSRPGGSGRFVLLASGTVATDDSAAIGDGLDQLAAARARCVADIPASSFYQSLADHDLQYGPKFQAVETVWRRDGEAVVKLMPAVLRGSGDDLDAAVALDACFQTLGAALNEPADGDNYLPTGLAELRTYQEFARGVWCHAVLHDTTDPGLGLGSDAATGDVFLLDEAGSLVAAARGLRMQCVAGATTIPGGLRNRIYQLRWQPASLTRASDVLDGSRKPGSWLIFSDGSAVVDTLRDHLELHSQTCVLVEPAPGITGLEHLGPDTYRVDPQRPEHFRRLLNEAFGGDRPPCRGVVHLWSLLSAPSADTTPDSLKSATTLGPLSAVYLLQALSSTDWSSSPRLWLVTRGVQVPDPPAVNGSDAEPVAVAQAPLWGIGRSIDHEHPELRCTCVDLPTGGPEGLRALFEEVWADGPELAVALRDHRRYVARLTRYDNVDAGAGAFSASEGFAPQASYLITGGLGALGGVVATWMVEHGARHVALMGRSAPSAAAQATLDRLRAAGAEVTVTRGDVTKADQVAAVLESIGTSMPPLRGVVHAAGVVDVGGFVERLDERRLRDVMAPKVEGAWNLHALTRDTELDFFVLFSSTAAILGSPAAANYGAANAFLDALAWHRRAEGRPALSVNWGPWAELGLLTQPELYRRLTRYGVDAMPAAEYLRALSFLLAQAATQAAVVDIDWPRWRPGNQNPLTADLHVSAAGQQPAGSSDGETSTATIVFYEALQDAAPDQRAGLLETYLRDLVAGKLGLAPAQLDTQVPLNSLGVDSLITLELRIQMERELGIVVPVARLLDGPSVVGLANWLADQFSGAKLPDRAQPAPDAGREHTTQPQPGAPKSTGIDVFTHVPELSDEAVDELLRNVLAEQQGTQEPVPEEGSR